MDLDRTPLTGRAKNVLRKKDIYTLNDIARIEPRTYYDYRQVFTIESCRRDNRRHAVKAVLIRHNIKKMQSGAGKKGLKYTVLSLVSAAPEKTFFTVTIFGTYYSDYMLAWVGREVVVTGRVEEKNGFLYMAVDGLADVVPAEDFRPGIRAVYRKYKGISENTLAESIGRYAAMQGEILEPEILEAEGIKRYRDSILKMHSPASPADIFDAKKNLAFYDLLYFVLMLREGMPEEGTKGIRMESVEKTSDFIKKIPYMLTSGQKKALGRMISKAKDGERINTVIQGDVGCGKTLVAQVMAVYAAENGCQTVLMAPKNRLAYQHYETFCSILKDTGLNIVLLNSAVKGRARRKILEEIRTGQADIIIGTQSCIGKDVEYPHLGLVIEDEEQQFGVNDKEALVEKAREGVHTVLLSATPISRTITNIIYGDKDVIQIKDKPAGRLPIETVSDVSDAKAKERVLAELEKGHQAYFIAPAIEDNDEYDLVGIESYEKELKEYFEPHGYKVGVMHGRMDEKQASAVMLDFKEKKYNILLSTTVIEVGIDVPNATVMVVEQSHRFGAAQLHQLRGRVGRGGSQSYCCLVSDQPGWRQEILCRTNDGFLIAEEDAGHRGPGDLLGTQQSGYSLYIEEILVYPDIYKKARDAADMCLKKSFGKILLDTYLEHEELKAAFQKK